MTPLPKWKWQIPLGIVLYHFKMYLTTLSFFSLVKVEECGYIFFHPDAYDAKGWRISAKRHLSGATEGYYYYKSKFFMI